MGTQGVTKVVFLIDTKSGSQERNDFSAIRLAVLKLLTHFSCRDGCINEKMRWGYRIFDSTKECHMYKKRAIWLQYRYKHFTDFEEHLKENVTPQDDKIRSEVSASSLHGQLSASGNAQSGSAGISGALADETPVGNLTTASVNVQSSSKCRIEEDNEETSSAYAVRYALQNVMNDFHWEEPDMCSPMKSSRSSRHRRKKRESISAASHRQSSAISSLISDGRQKHRRKEKVIFLIMQCPETMKTLEEFVGDATKLNSAFQLRDTFVTTKFLTDFCQEQNGSLFWLNTNSVPSTNQTHYLLGQMLGHMGGQVISIDWLMSRDSHVTSCLHSIQATQKALKEKAKIEKVAADGGDDEKDNKSEKKIPVPRNMLPLSIVIDNFLRTSIPLESGTSDGGSCSPSDSFRAVLCSVNADTRSELCMLRMMPMFTPESVSSVIDHTNSPASSSQAFILQNTEQSKVAKRKKTRNQSGNSQTQVTANQNRVFSLETGEDNPSHLTTAQPTETHSVVIRAKIDRTQLGLGTFDSSNTYSCLGYDLAEGSDDGEECKTKGDGRLSQWFREAMMDLSQRRMALIIELSSSASSMTQLGIMEPLTPSMASIHLIHPKSIMPLASAIAFQPLSRDSEEQSCEAIGRKGPVLSAELKRFVEKSAKSIVGARKSGKHAGRKLRETEDVSSLPEIDPEVMEKLSSIKSAHHEPFHPSWLEPWHISAPSRHTCDQVVEQLFSEPVNASSPSQTAEKEAFSNRLKSFYCNGTDSTEATSPMAKRAQVDQSKKKLKDVGSVRQSPRLKRMKSVPSYMGVGRIADIMANSIKIHEEASKPKVSIKEKKAPTLTKKKSDPIPINLPDVSSMEDLTKHLKQNYEDVLTQNSCSVRFTQSTVAVGLHFFQTSQGTANRGDNISQMRALITNTLLLTNKQLRERYADRGNDLATRGVRVQEVEIQTLLRLEMESVEPTNIAAVIAEEKNEKEEEEGEKDDGVELPEALQDTVDEAVMMLQTVAIFASADKLSAFLNDIVLSNYAETIPYMVRAIYEGLVKPVPLMLLSPGSDKTGVPSHKQPASYRSVSSGGSLHTLGSNSNRSRALVRHPSIADAAPKRIIGVPAKRMPNEKKKTELAEKKKKQKEQDNTAKTVKRNLFNDDDAPDTSKISRRRSVAVMESHSLRRSPRKAVRSSQLVLKTRVVKETPGKKQVLKAMLNKLDRARRRSSSKERATPGPGITLVIEESPEKPPSLIPPDVRRSPRVHTLKRRPSFYKKQDMRNAKLLGARIAGTSPPPVPIKAPMTSEKKAEEKSKPKLSPATFLLSAIISPKAKRESPAEAGTDSPSRHTRSKMTGTPSKATMESPGRSTVRTTPRAKARRRLNDQLVKDEPKISPGKDHSMVQDTPSKSPVKAFIGGTAIGLRQSPRLLQKGGIAEQVQDVPCKSEGDSANESLPVKARRSPRKGFRKLAFGSTENAIQTKDKAKPVPEGNKCEMYDDVKGHSLGDDKESVSKMEKSGALELEEEKALKQVQAAEVEDRQSSWFDELSEDITDKEQDMDLDNTTRHKRKRSTPIKGDLSTPPIKQRRARRDTCTPPYVPASKCITPEIINSWPRKKTRYNSPSPCTSKVLSPCDISPIKNMDDILASLASPPQSSSKKKGAGSGRKRKRQSPGVGSSEKKLRRSSVGRRVSPRAKGNLLNTLSSKNNLEQRCISPVFGKTNFDQLTLEAAGIKTGVKMNKQVAGNPKKQPARKCKSPGDEGSIGSEESLDELDQSFSPVFGKSMVTNPSASSESEDGHIQRSKSSNATRMSFIDQGLDSEADTDPEIDFPKLKSGEGSEDVTSDSEMAMLMSKVSEMTSGTEEADKPKRHLRRNPCENSSEDESSQTKLQKRKSPRIPTDPDKILTLNRTVSKKQSSEEKTFGKTLRNCRSSERQDLSDNDKSEVNDPKQLVPSSILTVPGAKRLEDVENTRPHEPPRKKKKRVTLMTRIPSSLVSRRSTPSRLSMTLKRPSAGEDWMVTNSPEPASLMGASGDLSFTASSISSADDDVFEGTSTAGPSPSDVASTPPTQSGKPSFVTTPLSATGLYSLMNSPMVASGNRKSSMGTPKSGRASRSSRRNLPLQ